jgi:hypothetical protein
MVITYEVGINESQMERRKKEKRRKRITKLSSIW